MKIRGNAVSTTVMRADLAQTDPSKSSFVRNKPDSFLPNVTSADNNKILMVVNGVWKAVDFIPELYEHSIYMAIDDGSNRKGAINIKILTADATSYSGMGSRIFEIIRSTSTPHSTSDTVSFNFFIQATGQITNKGTTFAIDNIKERVNGASITIGCTVVSVDESHTSSFTLGEYKQQYFAESAFTAYDSVRKVRPSKIIEFTVDGKTYQAVEGMTWAEFTVSIYNPADEDGDEGKQFFLASQRPDESELDDNTVYYGDSSHWVIILSPAWEDVKPTDVIIDRYAYHEGI